MPKPAYDLDEEILAAIPRCQYDPQAWALFAWDWGHGPLVDLPGPRDWQADINRIIKEHLADPKTRFMPLLIGVSSGHGTGKSAEMGMLCNWGMSCFPDARVTMTANTDTQLRTKTVPEVSRWFRESITAHWFDVQATSIKANDPEHKETWRTDFVPWSEHNTEAFAGLHNKVGKFILVCFDEASKIHDKVWETTEGALTDENTIIIWIVFGNPTRNSGRFRECFRRFRHRWVTRKIDSRTVAGTNKAQIAKWVEDYGEDSDFVKIRVRGEFPDQSALQFINAVDVDAAQRAMAGIKPEMVHFAPVILGVDPAWTGNDSFEIYLRQGLYSKHLLSVAYNDDDIAMANVIAKLEDYHKADAVFVDAGHGTGIVSGGKALGRSWHLVWFSGKPIDAGYLNKRAEMWGELRAWLKQGGAIDPKDDVLYQDLTGLETVPRLDGKIQLEAKEDMKERGLPSPNRGDALALTFAAPVSKASMQPTRRNNRSAVSPGYDPFGAIETPLPTNYR